MKEINVMKLKPGDRFQTTTGINCYFIKHNGAGMIPSALIGIRGEFMSFTNEEFQNLMNGDRYDTDIDNYQYAVNSSIASFRESFINGEENVKIRNLHALNSYDIVEYFTEVLIIQELLDKQYILRCNEKCWPDRVLLLRDGHWAGYKGESKIPLCVACIGDIDANTTVLVDDIVYNRAVCWLYI